MNLSFKTKGRLLKNRHVFNGDHVFKSNDALKNDHVLKSNFAWHNHHACEVKNHPAHVEHRLSEQAAAGEIITRFFQNIARLKYPLS